MTKTPNLKKKKNLIHFLSTNNFGESTQTLLNAFCT